MEEQIPFKFLHVTQPRSMKKYPIQNRPSKKSKQPLPTPLKFLQASTWEQHVRKSFENIPFSETDTTMMLGEERSHLKITSLKRQPVYYVSTTLKVAKGSSVDNLLLEVRCPAICFKTLLLIQAVIVQIAVVLTGEFSNADF